MNLRVGHADWIWPALVTLIGALAAILFGVR